MSHKKIAICLVTYNSSSIILDCLRSLPKAAAEFSYKIFICDNNSSDSTAEIINEYSKSSPIDLALTKIDRNLGYAGGNNVAIKAAIDSEDDFSSLLILNPDLSLPPQSIASAQHLYLKNSEIGGISPNLSQIQTTKNYKTIWGKRPEEFNPGVLSVDRLHGGFMLLNFKAVKEVGFIDENYFHYWEEIDYSLRFKNLGYKLLQDFNSKIHHDGDSFSGVYKPYRIYYLFRNQFYFARRNFTGIVRIKFLIRRFLSNTRDFIFFLRMGRFDLLMAGSIGIRDGLMGKLGKSESKYANYIQ